MQKIIIKTVRPQPAPFLISWLHKLFPDCEIHVVPSESNTDAPVGVSGSDERSDTLAQQGQFVYPVPAHSNR